MARASVLLLTLLAAGCAHPAPLPGTPTRAELEYGLIPVDLCAGDDSGTCDPAPMPERVRVIASHCVPIDPREGDPRAACRVTFRYIYYGNRVREYRRQCVELIQRSYTPGGALHWGWDFLADGRDRVCSDRGI